MLSQRRPDAHTVHRRWCWSYFHVLTFDYGWLFYLKYVSLLAHFSPIFENANCMILWIWDNGVDVIFNLFDIREFGKRKPPTNEITILFFIIREVIDKWCMIVLFFIHHFWVNKPWDWAVPLRCTFSACRPFVLLPFVESPKFTETLYCWVSWRIIFSHSHTHTLSLRCTKTEALPAFHGIIYLPEGLAKPPPAPYRCSVSSMWFPANILGCELPLQTGTCMETFLCWRRKLSSATAP